MVALTKEMNMRYSKEIETEVNENVEVLLSSQRRPFVEIWQGDDLVEFEYELIPELVLALLEAYKSKTGETA